MIGENNTSHSFRYQILAAAIGRYIFQSYSISKCAFRSTNITCSRLSLLFVWQGNIISLCHGMALGFLSPILPTLQSNNSPFHGRPITLTELSWVGSCYAIGTILGNFVFSPLASVIGQKKAVALIAVPNLVRPICSKTHTFSEKSHYP